MGVMGGLVMMSVWGECVMLMLAVSMIMLCSSSDSVVWKSCFVGELDNVGWCLSILSVWVVSLAVMGSKGVKKNNQNSMFFILLMTSLVIIFLLSFYVSDFMFFYVGFESSLVPIFFLILGWGYQPDRSQAGIYMMLYTLFGSLPLFFLILNLSENGSSYMYVVSTCERSFFFFMFLVGAFLVKFPMFFLHLWLLKAHVEAPVAGSMILAGVMLKMGGYGLVRFLVFLESGFSVLSEVVLCVSLWGGLAVSMNCLRQTDMKLLVASSSVVHMSSCIGGLFILSEWGMKGAVVVMVGHGLCSSGLFYLVNVVYERTGSRSMVLSKGLLNFMPSMCLWWFFLVSSNMSAPVSLNLLGEIFLLLSLVSWSSLVAVPVGVMCFLSGAYSLYLFSLSQHGRYVSNSTGFHSGFVIEYLVSSCHWIPLNTMVFGIFWLV
uniref:NADH dehydrogenase subunit 4 n=1 Tax=Gammarus nipponensis TaxID=353628 RepID=UPI00286B55D3|nr:NADH dehydrogenase subunit 4 [Gammarus nipponensis]WLS55464.1 NADH dehydrogenase subunit 4 [Gammarus nipponensis]